MHAHVIRIIPKKTKETVWCLEMHSVSSLLVRLHKTWDGIGGAIGDLKLETLETCVYYKFRHGEATYTIIDLHMKLTIIYCVFILYLADIRTHMT